MSVTYVSEGDAATPANLNSWLNSVGRGAFSTGVYGSVGDGVMDDTAAIQAAIDAAEAAGGGTVWMPFGTYKTSSNIQLKAGVHLLGEGIPDYRSGTPTSSVIQPTSAVTKVIYADDIRGCGVSNLTIDFVNAGLTCVGLEIAGTWHSHFEHIYLYNLSGVEHTGVQYKDGTTKGPYWCSFSHVLTHDNGGDKAGLSTGWKLTGDRSENQGVNATTLQNCFALDHQNGYVVDAPAGLVMISSQAEGCQTDGVVITYAASNACPTIIGGEYNGNGRYGINGKCLVIEASINSNDGVGGNQHLNITRIKNQRDLGATVLDFTSGGTTEITVGDTVTGATSGATGIVTAVGLVGGSWAGGTAEGTLHLKDQSGTFQSENLDVGASTNLATIAADSVTDIHRYLNLSTNVKMGSLIQAPSVQRDLSGASDTITVDSGYVIAAADNSGPYTLTSTPHFVTPSGDRFLDGQILVLHNDIGGNNRAFTIQDETTLAGSGIELQGPGGGTFTFTKGSAMAFAWDTTDLVWTELWRSSPANLETVYTFTSTDATPSVVGGTRFKTAGTTAITDFDNGEVGQVIHILATDSLTITHGTPIRLSGSVNFAMTNEDTLTLCMFNDQVWHEISRTVL